MNTKASLGSFSRLCGFAIIAVGVATLSISFGTQNGGLPTVCTQQVGYIQCDLVILSQNGGQPMVVNLPQGQYLKLINNSGTFIQVNEVLASAPNQRDYWGEYCAYLDDFSVTGQAGAPGIGEVGCTFKDVGETFLPVRWDGTNYALSIQPGSILYLGSNPKDQSLTYSIYAYPQSSGIVSFRYPQMDQVTTCNGTTQQTNWTPRRNTSGQPWYVGGATVYADGGGGDNAKTSVDAACVYILDMNGAVRWSYCNNGINSRGYLTFPTQVINNNEYLVLQASHRCAPSAGTWDYAGWLYVWY